MRGLFVCIFAVVLALPLWGTGENAIIGGRLYRDAGAVASRLRCGFYRGKNGCAMGQGQYRLDFRAESSKFRFNNVAVAGNFPVRKFKNRIYISSLDVDTIVEPLLAPGRSLRSHSVKRIILDPGHGGFDRGASGRFYDEKDLALALARRTAEILRRCGYQVYFTRNSDVLIPLPRRDQIANAARADLFVSIHCNATRDRSITGIECYCLAPAGSASTNQKKTVYSRYPGNSFDANNFRLAFEMQQALKERTGALDLGVKHSRFAVLRDLKMPGVLLEVGFLSNLREEWRLGSADYREKIARGIAVGIIAYHRKVMRQ